MMNIEEGADNKKFEKQVHCVAFLLTNLRFRLIVCKSFVFLKLCEHK